MLDQAPVVCDLQLPGAEGESGTETDIVRTESMTESLDSEPSPHSKSDDVSMLRMLVFGPPNDPYFVRHTLPRFCELFNVDWVEDTADGLVMVSDHTYQAVVAKLGTQGNLSYPVIKAFREKQGAIPFVAIDSYTAAANLDMRHKLIQELDIDMFATRETEDALFEALQQLAATA